MANKMLKTTQIPTHSNTEHLLYDRNGVNNLSQNKVIGKKFIFIRFKEHV